MAHVAHAVDHDRGYGRDIRVAAALSLAAVLASFLFMKQPFVRPYELRGPVTPIVVDPYSLTVSPPVEKRVPVRPSMPVPADDGKATDPSVGMHSFPEIGHAVTEPTIVAMPYWKVEVKPKAVHLAVPDYPELARAAGIEGRVTVQAIVDSLGAVSGVEVIKGSGSVLLDQAAAAAALASRFTPGRQNDRPVPVLVAIPFDFHLQ
jgi:TonB family protein